MHHAATEDSEDTDKEYSTDDTFTSSEGEGNLDSSDGDTDYEDICPENY